MRRSVLAGSLFLYLASLFITANSVQAQVPETNEPDRTRSATADTPRIQDALAALQILLEKSRKAEASTLSAMANSCNALHQQQKAIEQFQAARDIWRELGDREHEATIVAHIGDVYRDWGFPEQANRYYRDALGLYPATDKAGRGATLNNLSLTYFSLNNRKKCVESLDEALTIFRELGDRRREALALVNLGAAYLFLVNDPMKAVGYLQEAITRLELLNDADAEAAALDKMGVAWHNLGKPEMAGLSFQHALALFHSAGDAQEEAAVSKRIRTSADDPDQASNI
jgi:tetratricopeptide (TPR) repeat protein